MSRIFQFFNEYFALFLYITQKTRRIEITKSINSIIVFMIFYNVNSAVHFLDVYTG